MYYDKSSKNWSQHFLKQAENAKQPPPAPINSFPAMPLDRYAGTYSNQIYGDFLIKEDTKNLVLVTSGKIKQELPLTHWDRDIFILDWPYSGEEPFKVSFMMNPEGLVSKMDIDAFSREGSGDFIKITSDQK